MTIESDGCSEFIVDETVNKTGSEFIWLWIAIEPTNKEILGFNISKERNMFVAERFPIQSFRRIWETFSFNRWWNLVSTSSQVFEIRSSY